MATTRIISMHLNKGKTVAQCLHDRTEYVKNPDKTAGGELISAYACDPKTVDAEFLLAKREYRSLTGRAHKNDVIAYQIRQSFRPGEVTPEEANRIGYELAERFLKGHHAFIIATHCDKAHVHNHIIFNSTTLDCQHKFRDFLGSGRAVARLSDIICLEHELSVIETQSVGITATTNGWASALHPLTGSCCAPPLTALWRRSHRTLRRFFRSYVRLGIRLAAGSISRFAAPGRSRTSGCAPWARDIRKPRFAL